jgi:arylsulfate sulfotransferase
MKCSAVCRTVVLSLAVLVGAGQFAFTETGIGPVEVIEGPSLTMDPLGLTPLAGVVEFETNVPVGVFLRISDGIDTTLVGFPGRGTEHSLPVLGLKPDRAYEVTPILVPGGEQTTLIAVTDPLPDDFPEIRVMASDPARMEPGFTIMDGFNWGRVDPRPGYTVILNNHGEVVWYSTLRLRQVGVLDNGNLFGHDRRFAVERDLLGHLVRSTELLTGAGAIHHELARTELGTYLSLSATSVEVENYPTSDTDPDAPTQTTHVIDSFVVEFSDDGTLLNQWPVTEIMDPTRIGYGSMNWNTLWQAYDWAHDNAALYDPSDDSIVFSSRHQDAVVKFSRSTGELIWILGPHANWSGEYQPFLLDPVGAPFEWQYHQHAPEITPHGTILVFDNGNHRASPFDGQVPLEPVENYSRAVEYKINEKKKTIRQVWEFGEDMAEPLYAGAQGDVDWLDQTGNVLITFSATTVTGGVPAQELGLGRSYARIIEVDHGMPADVVFDVMLFDPTRPNGVINIYRSERFRGLYPEGVLVGVAQGEKP